MFKSSLANYPERGPFGDNKYRGNCTGYIIKDFIESFLPSGGLFVDPSAGGGTSIDVSNALGCRYFATDLHQGFDLLMDDLAMHIGELADVVWWHPPYGTMVKYSGNQWGAEPHPHDLSHMDEEAFTSALRLALMNIHDATKVGGVYGILMGNQRKNGRYYNWSSLVERLAPGVLIDEVIKGQFNCVSDSKSYSNRNLIRIAHEKLLIFRKDESNALQSFASSYHQSNIQIIEHLSVALRRVMQANPLSLDQIFALLVSYVRDIHLMNGWHETVRNILNDNRYFALDSSSGLYSIA